MNNLKKQHFNSNYTLLLEILPQFLIFQSQRETFHFNHFNYDFETFVNWCFIEKRFVFLNTNAFSNFNIEPMNEKVRSPYLIVFC